MSWTYWIIVDFGLLRILGNNLQRLELVWSIKGWTFCCSLFVKNDQDLFSPSNVYPIHSYMMHDIFFHQFLSSPQKYSFPFYKYCKSIVLSSAILFDMLISMIFPCQYLFFIFMNAISYLRKVFSKVQLSWVVSLNIFLTIRTDQCRI